MKQIPIFICSIFAVLCLSQCQSYSPGLHIGEEGHVSPLPDVASPLTTSEPESTGDSIQSHTVLSSQVASLSFHCFPSESPTPLGRSAVLSEENPETLGPWQSASGRWLLFKRTPHTHTWRAHASNEVFSVHSRLPLSCTLRWLQNQSAAQIRNYLYILANKAHPTDELCVYVGTLGLRGGMDASESEARIQQLGNYVSGGSASVEQVSGKDVVVVLGGTGAGKSTFINYLLGRTMVSRPLGDIDPGSDSSNRRVISVSPGEEEVATIGHGGLQRPQTLLPQVVVGPNDGEVVYCDCPGFGDSRGPEIDIANAVNIKRILEAARNVSVLVLVERATLEAGRGNGLRMLLNRCQTLFGGSASLASSAHWLTIGITKMGGDPDIDMAYISEHLVGEEDEDGLMSQLLGQEQVVLTDPRDMGREDFLTQEACVARLTSLPGLASATLDLQTPLNAEARQRIREIVEALVGDVRSAVAVRDHATAFAKWTLLSQLRSLVSSVALDRMIQEGKDAIRAGFLECYNSYTTSCYASGDTGNFTKPDELKADLASALDNFSTEVCGYTSSNLQEAYDAAKSRYAKMSRLFALLPAEASEVAFGAAAWKEYFGVDVGEEPALPENIEELLDGKAPFTLDGERTPQRIRDNHLLVLIPAKVNGKPFSLTKLGELVKRYFPGNKEGYREYADSVRKQFGSKTPGKPYWMLLTRTVLSGSRDENYSAQKTMMQKYSRQGYGLPSSLEAATGILLHYARHRERLYGDNSWTYTCCTATELVGGKWPLFVGGFGASGLYVHSLGLYDDSLIGVAGCWKL